MEPAERGSHSESTREAVLGPRREGVREADDRAGQFRVGWLRRTNDVVAEAHERTGVFESEVDEARVVDRVLRGNSDVIEEIRAPTKAERVWAERIVGQEARDLMDDGASLRMARHLEDV